MRKATRFLLLAFVFTVPWDVIPLPLVGSISRMLGLAAMGVAALTTVMEGRIRRPDMIFGLSIAFAGWVALSLFWTISYDNTLTRVFTYAQLVGSVWIVREFARTREQQESLLVAFCMGAFVPMASLLNNFVENVQIGMAGRFSASGVNADDLGLTLVIGIPMAWHLILTRRGAVRMMAIAYFGLAPLSIMLTGTRAAFIAGVVALLIVPLTLPRPSLRTFGLAAIALVAVVAVTASVVPKASWIRILSIQSEVMEGGKLTGRKYIWQAGLQVFPQHPILGVGAGSYGPAVGPLLHNERTVSHNVPLSVLVELGIIGTCVFFALLAACAWTIFRMPSAERKLWGVLMFSWFVGVMSVNWEYRKATWLLFALLAARGAMEMTRRESVSSPGEWKRAGARVPLAPGRAVAQVATQRRMRLPATVHTEVFE